MAVSATIGIGPAGTGKTYLAVAHAASLLERGDEVVHLVRREPKAAHEVRWDPGARSLDRSALDGVDAVVNLAGAGVGDKRWKTDYRAQILGSRVDATTTVATAIAEKVENTE